MELKTHIFVPNTRLWRLFLRGLPQVLFSAPTTTPSRRKYMFGTGMVVESSISKKVPLPTSFDATGVALCFSADTLEKRTEEVRAYMELLKSGTSPMYIELVCRPDMSTDEIRTHLARVQSLNIPTIVRVSVMFTPAYAADILRDPNCDALAVTTPVSWDDIAQDARDMFFETQDSPMGKHDMGLVTGKYLIPLVAEWIQQLRRQGVQKTIIAGGGILRPRDVVTLRTAGASTIFLEQSTLLRPWNIRAIVKAALAPT